MEENQTAVVLPTVENEKTVSVSNSTEVMKTCSKCGKTLPISEFGVDNQRPDGHRGICNTCLNERRRELKKQKRQKALSNTTDTSAQPQTKRCYRCGRVLPVTQFYKNKSKKDGYGDICKECDCAYHKEMRMKERMEFSKMKQEDEAISNMAADTGIGVVDKEAERKAMPFGFPQKMNRMMRIANGPETKVCKRCGKEKSTLEFSCDKGSLDGFSSKCKQCESELRKEYRAKKSEEERIERLNEELVMSEQRKTIEEQQHTIEELRAHICALESTIESNRSETQGISHYPIGAELYCLKENEISQLKVDDVDVTVSAKTHAATVSYHFEGGRTECVPGDSKLYGSMREVTIALAEMSGYRFAQ